jgi:hypothetical protein
MKEDFSVAQAVVMFIGIVMLIIALIIFEPLVIIWALNTLFPSLAIPYTFWTWLASLVLGFLVGPRIQYNKKSS